MNTNAIKDPTRKYLVYFTLAIVLMAFNCITFLLTPLVIGYDETFQLQAANRFAQGKGLTVRTKMSRPDDGDLTTLPEFINFWPAGYSFVIGSLLKTGMSLAATVKLVATFSYFGGCLCFLLIGWYLLKDSLMVWLMFLFPVIWRDSLYSRTDCMLWALTPVFVFFLLKGLLKVQQEKNRLQIYFIAASFVAGVTYWIRYAGIILFGSGALILLFWWLRHKMSWKNMFGFMFTGGLLIISLHGINFILSGQFGYSSNIANLQFHWRDLLDGWLSLEPLNALFFTPVIFMGFKRFAVKILGEIFFNPIFYWLGIFILDISVLIMFIRYFKIKPLVIGQRLIVLIGLCLLVVNAILLSYMSLMLGYTPALHLKEPRYYWPVYGLFFPVGLHVLYSTTEVFKKINNYLSKHWKIFAGCLFISISIIDVYFLCKVIMRDEIKPFRYSYGMLDSYHRGTVYNSIQNRGDSDRVIIVSQSRIDLLVEDRYEVFRDIPSLSNLNEPTWIYIIYSRNLEPYGMVFEVTDWVPKIEWFREKYGFKYREFGETAVCYGKITK